MFRVTHPLTDDEVREKLKPWVEWSCGTTIKGFRGLVWALEVYGDRCERLAQELHERHVELRHARDEAARTRRRFAS